MWAPILELGEIMHQKSVIIRSGPTCDGILTDKKLNLLRIIQTM